VVVVVAMVMVLVAVVVMRVLIATTTKVADNSFGTARISKVCHVGKDLKCP
jgi:hypothetical protein